MRTIIAIVMITMGLAASAQTLPHKMTEAEKKIMPVYLENIQSRGETTPPEFPVRAAAEWEEMQGVVISWQSFPGILTEIVRHSVDQGKVYIVTTNSSSVSSTLTSEGIALDSVVFLNEYANSIWIRDYGPSNVYKNNVDSLIFVDWIYNRPRPDDDAIPAALANEMGIPLYENTTEPYDLVGTGGNFMSDGFGLGFSSELIVEENPGHTEQEVRDIVQAFMGIDEYVLMETLPYDGIHHIDMHMKLLDEETLLVGQYPDGVADGPQIEANLQYVLNNYQTVFGTPFNVVRIPMPPDAYGNYPDDWGDYRTYTNALILNELVLVPIYGADTDEEALNIYREHMPGYEVVGIDCDDIIGLSGAIHCITHELGAHNPLLISHRKLKTADAVSRNHEVTGYFEHKSGIESATVMYRTDTTAAFTPLSMAQNIDSTELWHAQIPVEAKADSVIVQYYLKATANSGKEQVRPMTAPEGYWTYSLDTAGNMLPVANAGADQSVDAGTVVQLDGTSSYDPDGDDMTYSWWTNATIDLIGETTATPTFDAPEVTTDTTLQVYLEVADQVGSSETDTVNITVNAGISVKELNAAKSWKVFPNPATSDVLIAFDEQTPNMVRIVNANGGVVMSEPLSGSSIYKLKTNSFTSGLYLVQAIYENHVSTKRLIIK